MIDSKTMLESVRSHENDSSILNQGFAAWLQSLPPESDPLKVCHSNKLKWVYWYAQYVIGGRWPEAEPIILADPYYAFYYALYIIKGSWPEAEPIINRMPTLAKYYERMVARNYRFACVV